MTRARIRAGDGGSARRSGVAGTVWPLALLGIAAVAGVAFALGYLLQASLQTIEARRASGSAELLARELAVTVANTRDSLAALAGAPELRAALGEGDRQALESLAQRYRRAFPHALRLLIVPQGGLRAAPEATPPVGYALVDQVDNALAHGRGSVEVYQPGRPKSHINYVVPVGKDGKQPLGALVLSGPTTGLGALLAPPDGGHTALQQDSATIASAGGAANGRTVTKSVAGTPWRLTFTTDRPLDVPGLLDPVAAGAALAAAVIVLLLAAVTLGRRLRSALRRDGAAFVSILEDLAAGRLRTGYEGGTSELEPYVTRALEAARQHTPWVNAGAATDYGRDADEDTSPAGGDWQSGLEVTEEPLEDHFETEHHAMQQSPAPPASNALDAPTPIDPSILRAYDIRGVVDSTLTEASVRALGRALGSEAAERGQTRVVVGYDGRHSSPALARALAEGLAAAGRDVIDIGRVPTPVVYFAAHFLGTHAGIAVTGSHNPPEYNGLKMVIGGETLWGDAIQALGRRVASGDLVSGAGSITQQDVLPDYVDRIAHDVTLHRAMRIVVDCGNGVAGEVAPDLFRALGCEVDELFCDVDGDFPNHHPDPTVPENLEDLIARVTSEGADLGLAFDGDGDRLGIVDNRGKVIWADRQMMLFARDILGRNPGADIIFDVKCTSHLAELITENAGVPIMWKTGHSLVKKKLRETGAPLAGEMSGHIFFNDRWYGFDDGVYAGARLLEILSMDGRDSDAIFAELPEGVSTPEIRVDLAEGEPPQVIDSLLADAAGFDEARVTTTDGLRVDFPDGWGLVRASNTQPSLVLRFEGDDEPSLQRIQQLFGDRLKAARPGIELPF